MSVLDTICRYSRHRTYRVINGIRSYPGRLGRQGSGVCLQRSRVRIQKRLLMWLSLLSLCAFIMINVSENIRVVYHQELFLTRLFNTSLLEALGNKSLIFPPEAPCRDISSFPYEQEIIGYFTRELRVCLSKSRADPLWTGSQTLYHCDCIPTCLIGPLKNVDIFGDSDLSTLWRSNFADVKSGGAWTPSTCLSWFNILIIIPYRDRQQHLNILITHLIPILIRQQVKFRIVVVEQNTPVVFNKGAVTNAGFLESLKLDDSFDCVLFHDVDILLEDDRTLMRCSNQPTHVAAALDRWNYRLLYREAFGGVISLSTELFREVNGFSNSYFGWGAEDDDLYYRLNVSHNLTIYRVPPQIGRYTSLVHVRDLTFPVNPDRHSILQNQTELYKNSTFDGLTTLKYSVNQTKEYPLYTWFLIDLHMEDTSAIIPTDIIPEDSGDIKNNCRSLENYWKRSEIKTLKLLLKLCQKMKFYFQKFPDQMVHCTNLHPLCQTVEAKVQSELSKIGNNRVTQTSASNQYENSAR